MSRTVTHKCLYCENRYTRQDLVTHIEEEHEHEIPEGFTAFRLVFNYVNKKPLTYHGKCTECGSSTPWDENKGRYDRQCGRKACHDSYVKKFEENMMKTRGVTRISATEEGQKKMLAARKISGVYKFRDGGEKTYCGSYEKKALEFIDKVLEIKSADIMAPGPILEYQHNGKTHIYITDFYYQPYNLIIEVKDGGDNPNKRNMPEYRQKQIEKERYIIKHTNYNYLRLTNNDLQQLMSIFVMLKLQMVENTGERVIHVNEAVVEKEISKSDISSPYFVYGKNGVANCCVKIKGFKYPFRARSTMIPLRFRNNQWEIFAKHQTTKEFDFEYTFPGGGWNPNEDPMNAAIRETQEECKINIKNAKYCGEILQYDPDKVSKSVKENIPEEYWWHGYYTKIYIGLYKSKYTGKIEEIDKNPNMLSGQWYKYNDIKSDIHEKFNKAIEYYISNISGSKVTPLNEYMNAIMSGKVVGLEDSDTYIINYLPKRIFVGEPSETEEDMNNIKRKLAVSNGTFTKVAHVDEDGILSTGNFDEIIDTKSASYYKLDKTIHEVSDILKPYIGQNVSEYFVYESLTGKKLYTFDQIPFTLDCIDNKLVDIPDLVKDSILENKVDKVIKSVKEVINNG